MSKKINRLLIFIASSGVLFASVFSSPLVATVSAERLVPSSTTTTAPVGAKCQNTDATCGRCFNQLAGTVYYCSGGQFVPGSCSVYNNNGGHAGWSTSPEYCKLSQFAGIQPGAMGQTIAADEAVSCGQKVADCCKVNNGTVVSDCGIFTKVNEIISFLATVVGVACAIGIIFGGIEYSTSGGDPKRIASGKSHITKAVIAVVLFGFLYSFLQFVVPGGFLNG